MLMGAAFPARACQRQISVCLSADTTGARTDVGGPAGNLIGVYSHHGIAAQVVTLCRFQTILGRAQEIAGKFLVFLLPGRAT